ncbi:unnamed protein product [Toxocara canis]|uniref:Uncharacterized protein n=1 Tax=Toxocara canis TaxID=6265 RepID=A0A183UZ27_TOXCA|nr:unnamed protein product [Toxocara canis]
METPKLRIPAASFNKIAEDERNESNGSPDRAADVKKWISSPKIEENGWVMLDVWMNMGYEGGEGWGRGGRR